MKQIVKDNLTTVSENIPTALNSQHFYRTTVSSPWDCFSDMNKAIQDLTNLNSQIYDQMAFLKQISTQVKSIEVHLNQYQTNSSPVITERKRKIIKPRKTNSRTIMDRILNKDDQLKDNILTEIVVPGFLRKVSIDTIAPNDNCPDMVSRCSHNN